MIDFLIKNPFGYVLEFFYGFFDNYGIALILFSLAVKILLLPFSAKSKKSMMKTSRLQPMVKQIELACGDDKQRYQQEVNKLYKEEGVSMFGGCLWSFLPLLILLPLYSVIREPLQYMMHLDTEVVEALKEAFEAANGENAYWQFQVAKDIDAYRDIVGTGVQSLNFSFLGIDLGLQPSWKVWTLAGWSQIGGALIPLVSGALNYLSMFISQKMNSTVIKNEKGETDDAAAASSAQTGKMMNYTMPLISVIFGFSMPLGISIYWIAQSVFSIIQDYFLTKHYRKIYDAEDAVRREKAAQRAAEEAEKERIRAAKRAANPDGIKENTSKKKQQLREKQVREAAAKDFEAKKLAAQGVTPEEAVQIPGAEPNRPYARGRAYEPDRYSVDENKE